MAQQFLLFAASVFVPAVSSGGESPPKVDFVRDIEPILQNHCTYCHGADVQEGKLRLDAKAMLFYGGISGPAVRAGKGAESPLYRRVSGLGDEPRMPLDDDPLSDEQIALLRRWIDQGAKWPDGHGPQVSPPAEHWAYVKPVRPTPPAIASDWIRNPIDAFILEKLQKQGLAPSAEAAKARLLRRVTLDLTGVPPTIEELDAFLADDRPDAYERLADRLLESPKYGERWALPWLDAARYADSNGYQRDGRRNVWAYRDWVIDALNADMPFDRFTIEQIAGDLLPEPTLSQRIATGFHRGTMANVEAGTDPDEVFVQAIFDRVNTTATVWLGTTLECAQCHNHKYDPFTQRDYYRLFAFFYNTEMEIESEGSEREFTGPKIELPVPPEREKLLAEATTDLERLRQEAKALRKELTADLPAWASSAAKRLTSSSTNSNDKVRQETKSEGQAADGEPKLPDNIRKILSVPEKDRTPAQTKALQQYYLKQSKPLSKLDRQIEAMEETVEKLSPPTTLVMKEMEQPRTTAILLRGDFLNPGETVQPGTPGRLHPLQSTAVPDASEAPNPDAVNASPSRLDLAEWLVADDNPLTARVIVNRQWAEFFGQGLVTTPEDFGTQGEAPTHPRLLDYLATEFQSHRSFKRLHRLIVTSSTYRQSSRVSDELLEVDRFNRLYARGPRFRLRAELIRDTLLSVSGLLSDKRHGPPVFPYQPQGVWNHTGRASNVWESSEGEDAYRRGLYVYWRRTVPYPSFVAFDAPSREACTVQRSVSVTPLQALTLLNDPVYIEAAKGLATRLTVRSAASVEEGVTYAFRLATSRKPTAAEIDILVKRFQEEQAHCEADPSATAKLIGDWKLPADVDPATFAAWVRVANVILNLDEAITKG